MLFIEKLKQRAALLISTLGNGTSSVVEAENPRGATDKASDGDGPAVEEQPRDWIYEVVRSGWDCRVHRLEEFGARYIAYRLEQYIDDEEFKELVRESAARIKRREETDTVEIVDDIRYYLSERFRLRFEDAGLEEEFARFDAVECVCFPVQAAETGEEGTREVAQCLDDLDADAVAAFGKVNVPNQRCVDAKARLVARGDGSRQGLWPESVSVL